MKTSTSFPPDFRPGGADAEVIETHISWVFLSGDRAYKLRKPVVLPFLDYSSLSKRRRMAEEEVRLGRRLAPELYIGVRPLFSTAAGLALEGEGEPVEYAVETRRFSHEQTLEAQLCRGTVEADVVRSLGKRIAAFHAATPPCEGWGPEQVGRAVDDNFASLLAIDAPGSLARRIHSGHRFAVTFLDHRRGLLAGRALTSVREGHGDLRAEHVILGESVQIFDPIEFDPALRQIDVSADLGFLVMDLERHGRADLAGELLSGYRAGGGAPGERALVYFYAAYRAWVRAKVAWLRSRQHQPAGADLAEVEALAELGWRLAWKARGPLTLVICGPAASGKTHLARNLAQQAGLTHLNSDVVRKQLLGLGPEQRAPLEAYGEEGNRATYRELGHRAAAEFERGRTVVVDATFRSRRNRAAFFATYANESTPVFVECRAPASVLAARAEARTAGRDQPSDAGSSVALAQRRSFEPLDEVEPKRHIALRSDRPVTDVADELEAALDGRLFAPLTH
jgi:aminoglycoside phosphotransferase family enzyme/predicted kinase